MDRVSWTDQVNQSQLVALVRLQRSLDIHNPLKPVVSENNQSSLTVAAGVRPAQTDTMEW